MSSSRARSGESGSFTNHSVNSGKGHPARHFLNGEHQIRHQHHTHLLADHPAAGPHAEAMGHHLKHISNGIHPRALRRFHQHRLEIIRDPQH